MVETEFFGEIGVIGLRIHEVDVEPHRSATGFIRSSIRGLHNADTAARDDREILLRQPGRELFSMCVRIACGRGPCAAEKGRSEAVAADDVESLDELGYDLEHAPRFYGLRLTDQRRTLQGHRAPALVNCLGKAFGRLRSKRLMRRNVARQIIIHNVLKLYQTKGLCNLQPEHNPPPPRRRR